MLNRSHIEHAFWTLVIQAAGTLLLCWFIGAVVAAAVAGAFAVGVFFGREYDQHSFKHPDGPKGAPWFYGLIEHWTEDSIFDVVWSFVPALLFLGGIAWLL